MNIKYRKDRVLEILELLKNSKDQIINSKSIVEKEINTMKNLSTKINVDNEYLLSLYNILITKIDDEIASINNMSNIIETNIK